MTWLATTFTLGQTEGPRKPAWLTGASTRRGNTHVPYSAVRWPYAAAPTIHTSHMTHRTRAKAYCGTASQAKGVPRGLVRPMRAREPTARPRAEQGRRSARTDRSVTTRQPPSRGSYQYRARAHREAVDGPRRLYGAAKGCAFPFACGAARSVYFRARATHASAPLRGVYMAVAAETAKITLASRWIMDG